MYLKLHEGNDNSVIWINADKIRIMRVSGRDTAVKLDNDSEFYVKESPEDIARMAQRSPTPTKQ